MNGSILANLDQAQCLQKNNGKIILSSVLCQFFCVFQFIFKNGVHFVRLRE